MEPSDNDPTKRPSPRHRPKPGPALSPSAPDQYHALFHSMDQGFCVLELQFDDTGQHVVDFIYQQLNPVFFQQSGIPEGAQGKSSRELMPDLEPFWFDTYGRVALTGEAVRLEHYVPQVGRWFDVHTFRVGALEARQVGVLFHDITARKQAAAADTFRLQLADALAPLADPVAIQEAVTRLARQHFRADRCYYGEIEGGQVIIRRDAAADGLPPVAGTYPLAEFALTQATIEAGRPFSVRDVRADESVDERLRQLCAQLQLISYLNVPILKNGQAVGVLYVVQSAPRDWTAAEATLAAEVAERTWAAVERARAEAALVQSAEKYRLLFDSIDEGFATVEVLFDGAGQATDYRILELNQACEKITGMPRTVVGRRVRELVPDVEEALFRHYSEVVRTGEPVRYEQHVAGLGRWFDVFSSRVGGAGSRTVASVFNDITARKRHEANLTFLAEIGQDLVQLTSMPEIMVTLSEKIGAHFRVPRVHLAAIDEAAGTALVTHDWHAASLPNLADQRVHRLDDFVTGEFQRAARAGETIVVGDTREDARTDDAAYATTGIRAFVTAPFMRGGQWLALLSISDDAPRDWPAGDVNLLRELTTRIWTRLERARAEEELAASEAKYRTLFNSIDEGFVISELLYDEQGRPTDALTLETNPSYDRIMHTTGAAGRRAKEFFPESESTWFETYAHVVETGESLRFENYFAPLDSWIEMFVVRVGGAGSRRFASVFNDITARKRHENHAAFLDELSQALAVLDGPDEIVRATGEHLSAYLGVGFLNVVDVELEEGDELEEARLTVASAWEREGLPSPRGTYRAGDYLSPELLRAARAGEAIVIRNTDTDPRVDAEAYRTIGMQAFVAVPVLNAGAWPGLISAFTPSPRDWRPDEVNLLVEVGHRVFPRIERVRTEQALRRSEEQFRLFVTASSDVHYRMDADWQHMLRLDGRGVLTDTAAPTASWLETYIPPADQPAVEATIRAATAGPHFFALEHRVLRADGSVGWTSSHAVPVLNARGELEEWFGTTTDITARKQAEEALRASEQRQRALMANMPGTAVFVVGRDLRYQLAEGDALRRVGYEPLNFLGRTVQEMVSPEQWPAYQARYEAALAGQSFEYEHEQGDHTFLTRGVPLPDPAGAVAAVLAVSYDLTARRAAEEALRVSEAKYRTLFETMDQGFGVGEVLPAGPGRAADFRWLEVNPQVERLISMPQAALLGGETMRTVMPQLEDLWYERYERVALTGEPVRFDQYAQVLGRWFDVYAYALDLDGPAPHRVALLFTNITARKQAEEALRLAEESHRGQLAQQVAARTQELRESRDLLHAVFDVSPTSILVVRILHDAVGRPEDFEVLIFNEFTRRIVNRDDLAGQRYTVVFPHTVPTGILARLLVVARTGEPADFEQWYEGEGIRHWFRIIAVRQDNLLVITAEVITVRKQAEQERTRILRLLEQAEAVAGLGSWDYDLLSGQFLWSEGMYRLFGLPPGQAIGPNIYLDHVVAEDRPRAEQLVHCLTTGSADFEGTLRLQVGKQEVQTVRIRAVVFADETGRPVRVLGVDLNISQLQRLEAVNLRLRLTQQQALFEAVQAAQEIERKRMAESLHNGIGQTLYATKLRLDQLHAPLLGTNAALVAARNEADQLLSEAIRQTRALSHELVPMALEKFGLAASLQDIGSNMSTPQLGLRCLVQFDEDAGPLTPALQMALYRMAQELAQNVVKHARGATEASLELETTPGWVLLRAQDNGPGFAPAPIQSPGLGLRSIRDRVALLGGQLEMGTSSVGGAYVRIRIPLPASPAP